MTFTPNPAGTRNLTLTIGGTEWSAAITGARITTAAANSSVTTFSDAAAGGARQYTLTGTVVADYQAGSLWDEVYSNAGTTVAYVIAPYGGTPTATDPQFSGNCVIQEADGDLIGGDANADTTGVFTMDIAWPCTAKPTRVTA